MYGTWQASTSCLEDIGGSSSGTYMSKQFGVAVPPKTITTMQIYINEKCEEEQRKGSKVSRRGAFTSNQYSHVSWSIFTMSTSLNPLVAEIAEQRTII